MNEQVMLNLGCGTKTSDLCVNIDWSIHLRLQRNAILRVAARPFLGGGRMERLKEMSNNIVIYDLRKPLWHADNTVDGVYHSHVLEHIDRDQVDVFLRENFRVLKKGGILRICVPDLEKVIRSFCKHLDDCEKMPEVYIEHDKYVGPLLAQSVQKEASGTSKQPPMRRWIENRLLGDARARGQTHQWMYDQYNLRHLLEQVGFSKVQKKRWNESDIPSYVQMKLEVDENGGEYKKDSLYMECQK